MSHDGLQARLPDYESFRFLFEQTPMPPTMRSSLRSVFDKHTLGLDLLEVLLALNPAARPMVSRPIMQFVHLATMSAVAFSLRPR
jgi:hypothetical protein